MPINFFHLSKNISLSQRAELKKFIQFLFKKEQKPFSNLNYIFCSDKYLLEINRTYLNHNYLTDIITFNLSDDPEIITGEIYISIDRVRENAAILGLSIREEIHRVIFHGALHLCGFGDKTKPQKLLMKIKEDTYLDMYLGVNDSRGTV